MNARAAGYAVEVTGTVRPPALAHTPVLALPCVVYRVELGLWQRLVAGLSGRLTSETGGARFVLACRLGDLLLDPRQAGIELRRRRRQRVGRPKPSPGGPQVDDLFRRLARTPPGGKVSLVERWLEVGDRIWATGTLVSEDHAGGTPTGYRAAPTLTVLKASRIVAL